MTDRGDPENDAEKRKQALVGLRKLGWTLPPGFKFDREEASGARREQEGSHAPDRATPRRPGRSQ